MFSISQNGLGIMEIIFETDIIWAFLSYYAFLYFIIFHKLQSMHLSNTSNNWSQVLRSQKEMLSRAILLSGCSLTTWKYLKKYGTGKFVILYLYYTLYYTGKFDFFKYILEFNKNMLECTYWFFNYNLPINLKYKNSYFISMATAFLL